MLVFSCIVAQAQRKYNSPKIEKSDSKYCQTFWARAQVLVTLVTATKEKQR